MTINRRQMLAASAAFGAAVVAGKTGQGAFPVALPEPIPSPASLVNNMPTATHQVSYCLNTSTIRGQKLSVPDQIKVCAKAGYTGIEPWIGDLRSYVEGGGKLSDLRKQLSDSGLTIESAIGFARWIVDDEAERAAGLEEAKRDVDMIAELGGKRIAAPPIGAHQAAGPDLPTIAQRYRGLLEATAASGVLCQLELWGFSKTLSRLGELAYVATEAGHPNACVLPDVYHIYKGGSSFESLAMIEASKMQVFHMNDYPANPPRETINDGDRVYPGDGVAPLKEIFGTIIRNGFKGVLSLELFNESYWKLPADEVARVGLEKMQQVIASID